MMNDYQSRQAERKIEQAQREADREQRKYQSALRDYERARERARTMSQQNQSTQTYTPSYKRYNTPSSAKPKNKVVSQPGAPPLCFF